MTNILSESQHFEYADYSAIYKSCKAKEVTKCSSELENELKLLEQWSKNTNLVFNYKKDEINVILDTQNVTAPSTL